MHIKAPSQMRGTDLLYPMPGDCLFLSPAGCEKGRKLYPDCYQSHPADLRKPAVGWSPYWTAGAERRNHPTFKNANNAIANIVEGLLCAMYFSRHFAYMTSFHPYNNPKR